MYYLVRQILIVLLFQDFLGFPCALLESTLQFLEKNITLGF